MPGEISLAHNGVLFLDEFPEYSRQTLESLRQPLEDQKVTIARVKQTNTFPANFILIAAMNPCPCGYYGSEKCTCTTFEIKKYRHRISGPIFDRIDIQKYMSSWTCLRKARIKRRFLLKRCLLILEKLDRFRVNVLSIHLYARIRRWKQHIFMNFVNYHRTHIRFCKRLMRDFPLAQERTTV